MGGLFGVQMFDAVLERQVSTSRKLGQGAVVSVAIHALLIGGFIVISARVGQAVKDNVFTDVKLVVAAPPPPPPPPPPPAATKKKTEKTARKKDTIVKADDKKKDEPKDDKPPPPDVPGGVEGGVEGGVVGGVVGGVLGGVIAKPTSQVLPFGPGMTQPSCATRVVAPREAKDAKVEGVALVQCVVQVDGTRSDCKMIKSLPFMDRAILDAVKSQRCSSGVTYQGHPQAVKFVFKVQVKN